MCSCLPDFGHGKAALVGKRESSVTNSGFPNQGRERGWGGEELGDRVCARNVIKTSVAHTVADRSEENSDV